MNRDTHCCLCGERRRPTQKPVPSFGNSVECITIGDHRPLQEGRWETSPQMLVSIAIRRNGGSSSLTHICDGCIVVGLRSAKHFVDSSLEALEASAPPQKDKPISDATYGAKIPSFKDSRSPQASEGARQDD